jgi:hypothetical protein
MELPRRYRRQTLGASPLGDLLQPVRPRIGQEQMLGCANAMGGRSDNVAVIWHPGEGRRARVVRQVAQHLMRSFGPGRPRQQPGLFGSGITRTNEQQLTAVR